MSPRRRLRCTGALVAVMITGLGLTLAGCTSGGGDSQEQPSHSPTPLADFDSSSIVVSRTDFCDFVPDQAVEDAVGKVSSTDHLGSGSEIEVDGGKDVGHEFSCSWKGAKGTAQAWVFVPRITADRAQVLVDDWRKTPDCREVSGTFGDPGVGTVCGTGKDAEASYRGLFVDSWLTCTLQQPGSGEKQLVKRTGEWCVAAAKAAAGS